MKTETLLIVGAVGVVGFLMLRPKAIASGGAQVARSTPNVPVSPSAPWAAAAGQVGTALAGALSKYIGGSTGSDPYSGIDPNAMLTPF